MHITTFHFIFKASVQLVARESLRSEECKSSRGVEILIPHMSVYVVFVFSTPSVSVLVTSEDSGARLRFEHSSFTF